MTRRNGFQLGGGPYFAVPYHGTLKEFSFTGGAQVFVGI
jgi:hypothetical protein